MARKKGKPPKKTPKRTIREKPKSEPSVGSPMHDRRALEGIMRGLLGDALGKPDESPLGKAQRLIDEAFYASDPRERLKIARQALEVCPDCADAYVMLAEGAKSRKESLEFYEQAVVAGERALGQKVFLEDVGHFWGLLETRPYMRAREGLATLLWTMGRRDDAIANLQDMLRLNPNDNQGVRYTLTGWLVAEGKDKELVTLLKAYDEDDSAWWLYSKALIAFRQGGDSAEARKELKHAIQQNKHVPIYLLGEKMLPSDPPDSYSFGAESEAILYVGNALGGWKSTPGALAWLKESTPRPKPKAPAKPKSKGPTPAVLKRLEKLSQEFDVWQADFRQISHRIDVEGDVIQPWMTLVSSRSNEFVLAQKMVLDVPDPSLIWDLLAEAMRKPAMGEPHRPTEIQVLAGDHWDTLALPLESLNITISKVDTLDQLDALYEDLARYLARDQPPALLEMPRIDVPKLAGFYEAAAEFYRKAPWRKLGYEAAIQVDCRQFESGPWYAIVMGQSGMTLGVALYDDLDILKKLWTGSMSDEENARESVALTVTFDTEDEIPNGDLDAIAHHKFEIAAPDAFPLIFRKERGLSMRPPLAWELELMEGCLRVLPEFVKTHRQDDLSQQSTTVDVATRKLDFVLSWVGD
ncbi:DUF6930 domain-containing protein [Singulisphaera rosea]